MPEIVAALAVGMAVAVLFFGTLYALPYMLDREDEPPEPLPRMTVERARYVMQLYRRRTLDDCAEKRAAYRTLVEAGIIVPDARAERWVR